MSGSMPLYRRGPTDEAAPRKSVDGIVENEELWRKVWIESRIALEIRHSIRKLSTYSSRVFLLSVSVTTVKGSDREGRCIDASLTRTGRRGR